MATPNTYELIKNTMDITPRARLIKLIGNASISRIQKSQAEAVVRNGKNSFAINVAPLRNSTMSPMLIAKKPTIMNNPAIDSKIDLIREGLFIH